MKMKKTKLAMIALILIILVVLAQFDASSARVVPSPLFSSQSDCQAAGGSWSGSNSNIGTCTYASNSGTATQACGANFIYKVTYDIDFVATNSCTADLSSSGGSSSSYASGTEIEEPGDKCKLIEIDSQFAVAGTFHAKWIGVMGSIRFRQPLGGLEFISMIAGTLTYETVDPDHEHDHLHRAADFRNGFILDRGRWEATCWGPSGTFGTAFVIYVQ
jgi:hypothetical protein